MRKRISIFQRIKFLLIANSAISKLNTKKNRNKKDWESQTKEELFEHLIEEHYALEEAIIYGYPWEIKDECKDNIIIPIMIYSKAWGN